MLSILWASLKARPVYYGIVAASVFCAVMAVSSAQFAGKTLEYAIDRNRERIGPDIILVPPHIPSDDGKMSYSIPQKGFFSIEQANYDKEKLLEGIAALTSQLYAGEIVVGNKRLKLIGFDPDSDFVVRPWLNYTVSYWEFDLNPSQVILGANAATALKGQGGLLKLKDKEYQVKGILDATGSEMDDAIYFSLEEAREIIRLEDKTQVSWIFIRSENSGFIRELTADLNIRFQPVQAVGRGEFVGAIGSNFAEILQGSVFSVSAVFIIIATVLLAGTVFTINIWERTAEFGTMRAIGASRMLLFQMIVLESLLVSIIGGIMGVLGGFLFAQQYAASYYLAPIAWNDVMGFGLFFVTVAGIWCLLAALVPACLVLRQEPAIAMQKRCK